MKPSKTTILFFFALFMTALSFLGHFWIGVVAGLVTAYATHKDTW